MGEIERDCMGEREIVWEIEGERGLMGERGRERFMGERGREIVW